MVAVNRLLLRQATSKAFIYNTQKHRTQYANTVAFLETHSTLFIFRHLESDNLAKASITTTTWPPDLQIASQKTKPNAEIIILFVQVFGGVAKPFIAIITNV